jgi:hypothetical protein
MTLGNLNLDERDSPLSSADETCVRDCSVRELKNALKQVLAIPDIVTKSADEVGQLVLRLIKANRETSQKEQ